MPESTIGYRKIDPNPMSLETRLKFENKIMELLPQEWVKDREGTTIREMTEGAYQSWLSFYGEIERRLAPGGDLEGMTDWAGKLAGTVARLAALFHIIEYDTLKTLKISVNSMDNAISLGRFLIEHAKIAYSLMGTDVTIKNAKIILK